jgi:hypothetical protein
MFHKVTWPAVAAACCAAWLVPAAGASQRPAAQTLVFDAVAKGSFVDKPPTGPSPGDVELSGARLRDAAGRFVGTAHDRCVFTRAIPNDMLERCSGWAKTSEGTVTISGVGHLYSMNPPWQVVGRSGKYKGLHGTQTFATDIPLDPNVPLAPGRAFSVAVIKVVTTQRLHVGVVPRPAANVRFIRHAQAACDAVIAMAEKQPQPPFSNFDPFHPDKTLLPKVGRFFNAPARRRLPRLLLRKLEQLGRPPAGEAAWRSVLVARKALLANENRQIKAALADDAATFVRTVYQESRDFNRMVFSSAVFGLPRCTFG